MRLPKFTYFQPPGVAEAVRLLGDHPGAKALAWGTDLLVNMKHRVEGPPCRRGTRRSHASRRRAADGGCVDLEGSDWAARGVSMRRGNVVHGAV